MADLKIFTERNGDQVIINLDKVNRIIPVNNSDVNNTNFYFGDGNETEDNSDSPITLEIDFEDVKQALNL